MNNTTLLGVIMFLLAVPKIGNAQVEEDALGVWYMYFMNATFKESSWGAQGDIQYRNWNIIGDLEQLLLRGGLTYSPKNADIKFTLGYASISSGVYGDSPRTSGESRIYQEVLFPGQIGQRFLLNHRFRLEQRFVEKQNFRTRYRYNLFLNIPLNRMEMEAKTVYLTLYNELFINGQKNIGNGQTVALFDRNRLYGALGYMFAKGQQIQLGIMRQTTNNWSKNQLQLSLHQKF